MAYKALLIGNWDYEGGTKFPPLKGPAADIQVLHAALTNETFGLFAAENVTVKANLSSAELSTEYLKFLQSANKDDRLLLYFSGHGARSFAGGLALCGLDTDQKYVDANSLSGNKLLGWIEKQTNALSKVLILDCCYAGAKGGLADDLNAVLGKSAGTGTAVLASGGNEPSMDAMLDGDPSPFTEALTAILLDAGLPGDSDGCLTDGKVYEKLLDLAPPLFPKPYRGGGSQGVFALAKREPSGRKSEHKKLQMPPRVDVVDVMFASDRVEASWEDGSDTLELTALDSNRQALIRRVGLLADAVTRAQYVDADDWHWRSVEEAWTTVGANLFGVSMPPKLAERIRNLSRDQKNVLKLRLSFEQTDNFDLADGCLESYPWECMRLDERPFQGDDDEGLPLALRRQMLIERVARSDTDELSRVPRAAPASWTAITLNSLSDNYETAAATISEELTRMPNVTVMLEGRGPTARWSQFYDLLKLQQPQLLLIFAPIRRTAEGAQVGFIPTVASGLKLDWRSSKFLTNNFKNAELTFDAIVLVTFAANPGRDTVRGTIELARALTHEGIGPVAFACHAPGFESEFMNSAENSFPVSLIEQLAIGNSLDNAFWYAKNRIMESGDNTTRRTFGVPGYFMRKADEPRGSSSTIKAGRPRTDSDRPHSSSPRPEEAR